MKKLERKFPFKKEIERTEKIRELFKRGVSLSGFSEITEKLKKTKKSEFGKTFTKILKESQDLTPWIAAGGDLISGVFTKEEKEEIKKIIYDIWKEKFESPEFLLSQGYLREVPGFFRSLFLITFPLEKEKINEEVQKELTAIALKDLAGIVRYLNSMTEKFYSKRDKFYSPQFDKEKIRFLARWSDWGGKKGLFVFHIYGKEHYFSFVELLRSLYEKGLLNWSQFLNPSDRKRIKKDFLEPEIERRLQEEFEGFVKRKTGRRKITEKELPLSRTSRKEISRYFESCDLKLNITTYPYEGEKSMSTALSLKLGDFQLPPFFNLGWGITPMPVYDLRLNIEPFNERDLKSWNEILAKIYSEAFLRGLPIFVKTTRSDLEGSLGRIIQYVDYNTLVEMLENLKKTNLIKKIEERRVELAGSGLSPYPHYLPFGLYIPLHIRRTGEEDPERLNLQPEKEIETAIEEVGLRKIKIR